VREQGKIDNQYDTKTVPFNSASEAWFWFIQAQQARNEGARIVAGLSGEPRPCEPADFLSILDRLYRNRLLLRDHLLVLRHYGRRQYAPDPRRVKEVIASRLWEEAFDRIEPVLVRKGIVRQPSRDIVQDAAAHRRKMAARDMAGAFA
jgi:hypothetical protein